MRSTCIVQGNILHIQPYCFLYLLLCTVFVYSQEHKCFPIGSQLQDVMDLYFQFCSLEVDTEGLAVMGATLANGGICPITGDKVLNAGCVRDVLSLMYSCGMYNYSGEFAFLVSTSTYLVELSRKNQVVPSSIGRAPCKIRREWFTDPGCSQRHGHCSVVSSPG